MCCCVLIYVCRSISFCFLFNDTATTEIYTLSLHDALPILCVCVWALCEKGREREKDREKKRRSEEHTSELQSHLNLVCRLLLEINKVRFKKQYTLKYRSQAPRHRTHMHRY